MVAQKRALLIDDDDLCREVMAEILTALNCKVVSFRSAKKFLNLRNAKRCPEGEPCFDIILTDNHMPEMTGLDFLQQLKNMHCKIPDKRKAVISGNLSREDIELGTRLGCHIFNKPCPSQHIDSWLHSIE